MALVRQTIAQHADEIQDRDEEAHKLKQHAAYAKNEAAKALKEEQVSHAATKERLTQERVALASRSGSRLLFCLMKYKLLDEDYKVCEARVVHARLVVWYQRSRASTLYNWYQTQVEELKEEVTETTQKHQEAQESADKGWRAAGKAEKQIGRAKAEVDEMAAAFNSEIKLQKRKFKQDAKDMLETKMRPVAVRALNRFMGRWEVSEERRVIMAWTGNRANELGISLKTEQAALQKQEHDAAVAKAKHGLAVIQGFLADYVYHGQLDAVRNWRQMQVENDTATRGDELAQALEERKRLQERAMEKVRFWVRVGVRVRGRWKRSRDPAGYATLLRGNPHNNPRTTPGGCLTSVLPFLSSASLGPRHLHERFWQPSRRHKDRGGGKVEEKSTRSSSQP